MVTVRFEPAAIGPFTCLVETGHDGCDVFLSGVGVAPPLELSLGILQNPYLTQFIDIFMTASASLDPASLSLSVGGNLVTMELIDATENVWKADYELTGGATVQVDVCATSNLGASKCVSRGFAVFAVTAGEAVLANSPDGDFHVRIGEGSLKAIGYLLVIPSSGTEGTAEGLTELSSAQTGEALLSFVVSPPSLFSSGSVSLEFRYADLTLPTGTNESQLVIEHSGVGLLQSVINPEDGVVRATAGGLGEYRLLIGPPGSSKVADPRFLRLDPNYPNPFNPATTIRFEVETAQHVRLDIYDVSGRLVRTLVDEKVPAGVNHVRWDSRSQSGDEVSSGVYFARIRTTSKTATRKMVLIR